LIGLIGSLKNPPSRDAQSQASNSANTPKVSPTPELTNRQKIDRAKTLISESATNDELKEALALLKAIPKGTGEYRDCSKLLDQAARIILEREVVGTMPISSPFDGSVSCVKTYLSQTLNDYGSSEFVAWSPVGKVRVGKEPYWAVSLRIRAKNAFGAYIVKDATFYIRQGQVVKTRGL
jgi:hypothetical protein